MDAILCSGGGTAASLARARCGCLAMPLSSSGKWRIWHMRTTRRFMAPCSASLSACSPSWSSQVGDGDILQSAHSHKLGSTDPVQCVVPQVTSYSGKSSEGQRHQQSLQLLRSERHQRGRHQAVLDVPRPASYYACPRCREEAESRAARHADGDWSLLGQHSCGRSAAVPRRKARFRHASQQSQGDTTCGLEHVARHKQQFADRTAANRAC